ncbi:MAG: prepilin-type N-terminal cleavage/methylation domain-containing protein [Candidatus Zambryskibacteria bacterium]|nr:prepilin-type N-terminal cleavage/methylation domain-containing protein [Candidatus Zambryskibacteria bacterium]
MSSHFKNTGFSLVELIVSIGIASIILTAIISNQSSYSDSIALSNLADDISLSLSQAQTYGAAVREAGSGSANFSAAYGLSFTLSSNKAYVYFTDLDGDKIYDAEENLSQINISRDNYIADICAVKSSSPEDCGIERVDITFIRPKTEPQLVFSNPIENVIGAKITLKSPAGRVKSVIVYTSGQITVQ